MQGRLRLRAWEIRAMTIPEVMLAVDDDVDNPRPPGGGMPMSPKQIKEHALALRDMTLRQRIEATQEGRL